MSIKERWQQKLVISLNSDLCVASGDGFSSSVDVDVCFDRDGYPIIPGRRLKGCLREVACVLGYDEEGVGGKKQSFDALFGVSGAARSGSLRIANAHLVGAENYASVFLGPEDKTDSQKVLSLFTYTRAQTAIGNDGSAKDNTLRFVRVVKHYAPATDEESRAGKFSPLVFEAVVSCDDDEAQREIISNCVKALRNIGHGRNRGFGAVSCTLKDIDDEGDGVSANVADMIVEGDIVRVAYTVRLDSPLMLPQQNGNESLDYIPGTSVMGYFASRLSDEDCFDDVFLRGNVRFSPLYPVVDGLRACPAPPFIVKVKGGERDGQRLTVWQTEEGETVKPLKSGFIGQTLQSIEVESEVVYHHSVSEDTLYTQQCLQEGQLFSGFFEGDVAAVKTLLDVLHRAGVSGISFGRSKTAQYSGCSLVGVGTTDTLGVLTIHQGLRYAFILDSDVLLVKEGHYSTNYEALADSLRMALGVSGCVFKGADVDGDCQKLGTSLRYRTITGYNAKWNQKKPHVRAFAAGSSIVFEAAADRSDVPCELFVGERQTEGFGRVRLVLIDDEGKVALGLDGAPIADAFAQPATFEGQVQDGQSIEALRYAAIEFARKNKRRFGSTDFGRAFIGRLERMVDESQNHKDFDNRIESIKTKSKRDAAVRFVEALRKDLPSGLSWSQEKECLALVFTLGKYLAKQAEEPGIGTEAEGGAR